MYTHHLTISQLKYAVASALGHRLHVSDSYQLEINDRLSGCLIQNFEYETLENAGNVISVLKIAGAITISNTYIELAPSNDRSPKIHIKYAGSTLEAIMRCFVEYVFGKVVPGDIAVLLSHVAADAHFNVAQKVSITNLKDVEEKRIFAMKLAYWDAFSPELGLNDFKWLLDYLGIKDSSEEQQKTLFMMLPKVLTCKGIMWGFDDTEVRDELSAFVDENRETIIAEFSLKN